MAFERFLENTKSEYGEGIILQEYGGRWYLVEASKPKKGNGTVFKTYGYKTRMVKGKVVTIDKDGNPVRFPWSVCIGHDTEQAKSFLQAVLRSIP